MKSRVQFVLIAVFIALMLAALAIGIPRTHFATSVIDLLPGEDAEVEILRELSEQDQGRLLTVRLYSISDTIRHEATGTFVESLRSDPSIETVWISDSHVLEAAGSALFENRYHWLLPLWLDSQFPGWDTGLSPDSAGLADRVVDNLGRYLESPEGMALVETIPSDPFLLMEQVLASAGLLSVQPSSTEAFLWVRQKQSPFTEAGQEPVFSALEAALRQAGAVQPDLLMEYTGVARFAAASKSGIKSEIQRLNLMGLLLVLAITVFWVRAANAVVRISLVVLVALLTAATAVITAFSSVHVIALVIGSILTGIAVDYGFHLILVERRSLPERAVIKAVITGSISSAMGFIVLIWAPLPFLKQVGAFVGAGLLAALLAALLLRPSPDKAAPVRPWHINPFSLPAWTGPLLLLLLLPGLHVLKWEDRINDLEFPLPNLKEDDFRLRNNASALSGKSVFLIHGDNMPAVRDRLAALEAATPNKELLHAGAWIPPYDKTLQAQAFFRNIPDFSNQLKEALSSRDFLPDAFAPFFMAWEAYLDGEMSVENYAAELSRFATTLPGPLRSLVHTGEKVSWFMVLAPEGYQPPHLAGLLELDQGRMFSQAFKAYRETMILFGGSCLLALALGVLLAYGIIVGLLALAIPSLAVLLVYGFSGYTSTGLSLFHVVGTLLAFCISLDYALFAVETYRKHFRLPGSISISALTTIGVFGILATSQIPAIRHLALTVLLIICATLFLIVAGWPLIRRGAVPGRSTFRRLPHGPEALYVERIETFSDKGITVVCDSHITNILSGEWMIEAMAQAAAILLATTRAKDHQPRSGMLVVIQEARINPPAQVADGSVFATVEALTDADEGLLIFKGTCHEENGALLAESTFSIFIPPPSAASSAVHG